MQYYVEIVHLENDEVLRRIGPVENERTAEKMDLGANVNLDHQTFFTRVVSEEGGEG